MKVVRCIHKPSYTIRLTEGMLYEVVGETDTCYRIIDDCRDKIYFNKDYFDVYGTFYLHREGGKIEDCPRCGCRVYEYSNDQNEWEMIGF